MLFTTLLVVLTATPAPASWRFETGAAPEVNLDAINGSIQVEAVEEHTVSVEARREDGTEVKPFLDATQQGDRVQVRVCCGPCAEPGASFHCSNPVPVHLVVKVPRGSALEVHTVEAPVKVAGVTGALKVNTVNGDVSLHGSRSRLEVSTVAGRVDLRPEGLTRTEVSTVSGDVKLALSRELGARVKFSSMGGRFNGQGVSLGSREQRHGDGQHPVEVSTVSGSLDIQ